MRNVGRVCTVALAILVLVATTVAPALAHGHRITSSEPVFDGLVHEQFSIRLDDGSVARGNIVRFRQDHEHLRLQSVLARDRVAGLETTPSMALREQDNDALAGTNGGYWLPRPHGAPNGFAVQAGTLVGGQSQTLNGFRRARGVVGVQPSGALMMDRLNTAVDVRRSDGTTVEVDEVNLQPRVNGDVNVPSGELILYDRLFGTPVEVPSSSVVVVVDGMRLPPSGWVSGTVSSVTTYSSSTTITVPRGTSVLLAHGTARDRLDGVAPGQEIAARVGPSPLSTDPSTWGSAVHSVPGGPLLLRDGRRTSTDEWRSEGFSDSHLLSRHPRTAIGLTGTGEVLMVTVDGRQPGHSVGMSVGELQRFMEGLGAREALNLDGGGSTTMTVDAEVRNRPSETGRRAANGLFVYHSYPFDGTDRVSGDDRAGTAAAIAQRTHPDGATQVVVATASDFPDALAGGPLAAHHDAPLLLSARDHLPEATLSALDQLQPDSAVILGGTAVITEDVRTQLESRGIAVRRVAGDDRFATAATIGTALVGHSDLERVFLATGRGFADALSAAAPAGMLTAPILLTERDRLPEAIRTFLEERDVGEVVIVGGTTVVSRDVEDELTAIDGSMNLRRLAGDDRYGTARQVNEWAEGAAGDHDARGLLVASGDNFPDALAGGPLGVKERHLLMIVPPEDVRASTEAATYLDARGDGALEHVTLLGGRRALTVYQRWQLDQIAIR